MKNLIKIVSIPVMVLFIIFDSAAENHSHAQASPKLNNAQVASVVLVGNKIDIQ